MTRCFPALLVKSIYCLVILQTNGQITGNLNVKDPKAIAITENKVKMLCGNKWLGLKIIETRRGLTKERELRETVEFPCDGEYKSYGGINDGVWEVVNNQFIRVTMSTKNRNRRYTLNGSYSIYELLDSTLIFGQVLTSSGDWVKQFLFTRSEKIYSEHHKPIEYSSYQREVPQEGKTIKYHSNGNISSVEYYEEASLKVPKAEQLSIGKNFMVYNNYNAEDSTYSAIVPVGDWVYYYPEATGTTERPNINGNKQMAKW